MNIYKVEREFAVEPGESAQFDELLIKVETRSMGSSQVDEYPATQSDPGTRVEGFIEKAKALSLATEGGPCDEVETATSMDRKDEHDDEEDVLDRAIGPESPSPSQESQIVNRITAPISSLASTWMRSPI